MELIEFLRARLDEDEAAARDAIEPRRPGTHWHWINPDNDTPAEPDEDGYLRGTSLRTAGSFPPVPGVICRRQIIELHAPDRDPQDDWHGNDVRCRACGGYDLVAGHGERGYRTVWPCTTLKLLALPYADHPDYREEWKL